MLHLFGPNEGLFHTGWFIESLATQVLVIFAIRTRRRLFRSRPHPLVAALAVAIVALAVALPMTPLAPWLGFVPLPAVFFLYLAIAVAAYLGLVELVKSVCYRHNFWMPRQRRHAAAMDRHRMVDEAAGG
jgi:Mg2+-importing ATPase